MAYRTRACGQRDFNTKTMGFCCGCFVGVFHRVVQLHGTCAPTRVDPSVPVPPWCAWPDTCCSDINQDGRRCQSWRVEIRPKLFHQVGKFAHMARRRRRQVCNLLRMRCGWGDREKERLLLHEQMQHVYLLAAPVIHWLGTVLRDDRAVVHIDIRAELHPSSACLVPYATYDFSDIRMNVDVPPSFRRGQVI